MRKALGLVIVAWLGGCSMLFVEHVPETYNPKLTEPYCTGNKGFVVWDGLLAATHIVDGGVNFYLAKHNSTAFAAAGAINVVLAIVHIVSANGGSHDVEACRLARHDRETALIQAQPAVTQ